MVRAVKKREAQNLSMTATGRTFASLGAQIVSESRENLKRENGSVLELGKAGAVGRALAKLRQDRRESVPETSGVQGNVVSKRTKSRGSKPNKTPSKSSKNFPENRRGKGVKLIKELGLDMENAVEDGRRLVAHALRGLQRDASGNLCSPSPANSSAPAADSSSAGGSEPRASPSSEKPRYKALETDFGVDMEMGFREVRKKICGLVTRRMLGSEWGVPYHVQMDWQRRAGPGFEIEALEDQWRVVDCFHAMLQDEIMSIGKSEVQNADREGGGVTITTSGSMVDAVVLVNRNTAEEGGTTSRTTGKSQRNANSAGVSTHSEDPPVILANAEAALVSSAHTLKYDTSSFRLGELVTLCKRDVKSFMEQMYPEARQKLYVCHMLEAGLEKYMQNVESTLRSTYQNEWAYLFTRLEREFKVFRRWEDTGPRDIFDEIVERLEDQEAAKTKLFGSKEVDHREEEREARRRRREREREREAKEKPSAATEKESFDQSFVSAAIACNMEPNFYCMKLKEELQARMDSDRGEYGISVRRTKTAAEKALEDFRRMVPRWPYCPVWVGTNYATLDVVIQKLVKERIEVETKMRMFRNALKQASDSVKRILNSKRITGWNPNVSLDPALMLDKERAADLDRSKDFRLWLGCAAAPVSASLVNLHDATITDDSGSRKQQDSLDDRLLAAMDRLSLVTNVLCDASDGLGNIPSGLVAQDARDLGLRDQSGLFVNGMTTFVKKKISPLTGSASGGTCLELDLPRLRSAVAMDNKATGILVTIPLFHAVLKHFIAALGVLSERLLELLDGVVGYECETSDAGEDDFSGRVEKGWTSTVSGEGVCDTSATDPAVPGLGIGEHMKTVRAAGPSKQMREWNEELRRVFDTHMPFLHHAISCRRGVVEDRESISPEGAEKVLGFLDQREPGSDLEARNCLFFLLMRRSFLDLGKIKAALLRRADEAEIRLRI